MTTATAAALLASAWAGALLGTTSSAGPGVALTLATVMGAVALIGVCRTWWHGDRTAVGSAPGRGRGRALPLLVLGCLLVGAVSMLGAATRSAAVDRGPLAARVADRLAVTAVGTIVRDVRDPPEGRPWVVLRLDHLTVVGGDGVRSRERVLLRLPPGASTRFGGRYRTSGVATPIQGPAAAGLRQLGVVVALDAVHLTTLAPPPRWVEATTALREGVRAAAGRRLDPPHASLLTGLVTGDLTGQPDEVAADVMAAGLSHLVAVSGSNVALVAAGAMGVTLALGGGRRAGRWAVVVTVWWFVVLVRAEPSVLRAATAATLVVGAMLVGRRRSTPQLLCTAGLVVLLVDPLLSSRLGFALSIAATAGVVVLTPALNRRLRVLRRLPGPVRGVLAATCGAQLAVAPILLATGGSVHPATLPANVVAVPAAAVASVIGSVAAALCTFAPGVAAVVAALARPALAVVLWSARTFADGAPRHLSVIAAGAICAGLLAVSWPHLPRPVRAGMPVLVLVAAVVGLPGAGLLPGHGAARPERPVAVVLDVGQGDAVLLGDPVGGWVLVDGGPDPVRILEALGDLGVTALTAVVATHPHVDHYGGLVGVLDRIGVGALLIGPTGEGAAELLAAARAAEVGVRVVADGDGWSLGSLQLQVLSPPLTGLGEDPNDNSLVIRVDGPASSALLAADAEVLAQTLLRDDPRLDVDVLKVPHHGGATNAPGFLTATTPGVAVISVGRGNSFGHPHPDVLAELAGVDVRRTDLHGDVVLPLGP